jgi:hypothetical protein
VAVAVTVDSSTMAVAHSDMIIMIVGFSQMRGPASSVVLHTIFGGSAQLEHTTLGIRVLFVMNRETARPCGLSSARGGAR